MQYNLTDDRVVVENLQKMLRSIYLATGDTGYEVGVTGDYGEGTEQAVRYFQQTHLLPVTGIADYTTWQVIVEEYRRLSYRNRPPVGVIAFPDDRDTVLRPGESGDPVVLVQLMLNALSPRYHYPAVPVTGQYDTPTTAAVGIFQRKNQLTSPAGHTDRITWDRMAEEYNLFRK